MDGEATCISAFAARLHLGMLIQWQQGHDSGYAALEQSLRRDLLAALVQLLPVTCLPRLLTQIWADAQNA